MTQEEKELLLRDLCVRLPYGVKIYLEDFPNATLVGVVNGGIILHSDKYDYTYTYDIPWNIEYVKPYLFPLSSITEEQAMELFKLFGISLVDSDYIKINECTGITFFLNKGFDVETHLDKLIDWLNKKHFDYRGLIPIGAAIDATGLNLYN